MVVQSMVEFLYRIGSIGLKKLIKINDAIGKSVAIFVPRGGQFFGYGNMT